MNKLTIGMATYDDYLGVFFTLEAIKLYHSEILNDIEFIVIDNNPGSLQSKYIKKYTEKDVLNCEYISYKERVSTFVRFELFKIAKTPYVLCIDSHVLIEAGALKKLLNYYDNNPDTKNLLQGPVIRPNGISTHFDPIWEDGMYGHWATDERGLNPEAPPFEIEMQGLGLFSCKKEAFPEINTSFKGFGGDEGYIHEKFRQNGGKVLCLPFLRWVHHFKNYGEVPYPLTWKDRVTNYEIAFKELGWDLDPMYKNMEFSKIKRPF